MNPFSPNRTAALLAPLSSPCTGVCRIGDDGLCLGCRRTLAEIARWGTMSEAERRHCMEVMLPARLPAGKLSHRP